MARVLVTGMSGAGKSSALELLRPRGYAVLDADLPEWSGWDPSADDGAGSWLWREDPMTELLAEHSGGRLVVAGCASNQGRFYDRFEAVVLLTAPVEVLMHRIATRTTNGYGRGPGELDRIRADIATVEPLLRRTSTHVLDATRPLRDVVVDIAALADG